MRLGRRSRMSADAEQVVGPTETYRVAVAHTDAEHPCAVKSHWGPAYNTAFADLSAHILDVSVESVDLEAEARKGAARARDEYSGMDGWEVWVERLTDSGWERVS